MKVKANGDIRVAVNGSRWTFNPKCLSKATGETPIEEETGMLSLKSVHAASLTLYIPYSGYFSGGKSFMEE